MYAYISGKLEGVAEDAVIIDNHGIGYQILVPSSTLDRLPSVGGEVKVYTYLQVREDAMVLFGFLTKEELELIPVWNFYGSLEKTPFLTSTEGSRETVYWTARQEPEGRILSIRADDGQILAD